MKHTTRSRVDQLEAQRAAADQAREEMRLSVYEETAAAYANVFDRVLAALDLTAAQHEQARALLVAEIEALNASREQQ